MLIFRPTHILVAQLVGKFLDSVSRCMPPVCEAAVLASGVGHTLKLQSFDHTSSRKDCDKAESSLLAAPDCFLQLASRDNPSRGAGKCPHWTTTSSARVHAGAEQHQVAAESNRNKRKHQQEDGVKQQSENAAWRLFEDRKGKFTLFFSLIAQVGVLCNSIRCLHWCL